MQWLCLFWLKMITRVVTQSALCLTTFPILTYLITQWRRKRSGRSGQGRYTFWAPPKKSIAAERLRQRKPRLYQSIYELLRMRSRCARVVSRSTSCTKQIIMCSIVIRDRLSVIVWRGATSSCRCLEREVSPVASSLLYC